MTFKCIKCISYIRMISGIIFIVLIFSCKDGGGETTVDPIISEPVLPKISVEIDKSTLLLWICPKSCSRL